MDGGNGKPVGHLFERDFGRGLHALGGELSLAENQRQSHREASGVCRTDQFFGIGAGLALEPAAKAIGIFLERAALGRDGAFAVLDSAVPDGRSMSLHVRFSLSWLSPLRSIVRDMGP